MKIIPEEKMNVLFIITDQQRADHLSCMGNLVLKTPNIDRIANGGVRFTNYFCANPMCMPNRASFFTGKYPSEHKTRSNGINLNPKLPMISKVLKNEGYHTCSIGKLHFNPMTPTYSRYKKYIKNEEFFAGWFQGDLKSSSFPIPYYGFDEVKLTTGHGDVIGGHYFEWLKEQGFDVNEYISDFLRIGTYYYDTKVPEELYPTSFVGDHTLEYLERTVNGEYGNNPFFLHCSFPDPHHPVCPPGKYKDLYNPDDIELPSNFKDSENLLNHEFLGRYLNYSKLDPQLDNEKLAKTFKFDGCIPQLINEEIVKNFTALTYGSIAMIDDRVGKILDYLEESGLAENTMVIYASDHGEYCGDHGLLLKGPAHFRGLINMPLLWKVPGLTKSSVSDSLVSTVDLSKTILSLLGMREKQHPEIFHTGYDITPILEDPNKKLRKQLLIEHDDELQRNDSFRLRTLITETHRLTIYDGLENCGDIFNYEDDPGEVNNLWEKDSELKFDLTNRLMREIISLQPRLPTRKAQH